jgi:hypothetical protein
MIIKNKMILLISTKVDSIMKKNIHQIYYSNETKETNDPGFIPLNNLSNLRPDWQEYWPIRNYLKDVSSNREGYFGFFSPKFKSKTGLDSGQVKDLIDSDSNSSDVYIFSPFFDQIAFFKNIFEQGYINQPTIDRKIYHDCFLTINDSVNIDDLIMNSTNTIFCNYFVAKMDFWEEWLICCEKIFEIAEYQDSWLSNQLNSIVKGSTDQKTIKPFIIERVASFLLATNSKWKIRAIENKMIFSPSRLSNYREELLELDNLKILFDKTKNLEYVNLFDVKRQELILKINHPS